MKYIVTMLNTKRGSTEKYQTTANSREELNLGLDVFIEGGYEVLMVEAVEK